MQEINKKTIKVVAAAIIQDGKFFIAERAYGECKGKWEFPGGKVERGESNEEALVREIREELSTDVCVGELLASVVYEYPTFVLDMDVYACKVASGRLEVETGIHSAEKFVSCRELPNVDWCPADRLIAEKMITKMEESK